jgi:hypothetical protein
MLRKLLFPLLCLMALPVFSQSDEDIIDKLLGAPMNLVASELDNLNVYYYVHSNDLEGKIRRENISIANGQNHAKYYILKATNGRIIDKIVVNYRHGSYDDLKDLETLESYSEKNAGKFSTDIIYLLEDKNAIFATEKFYDLEDAVASARKSKSPDVKIYLYNDKVYTVGAYHHEDENYVFFMDGKVVAKDKLKEVPFDRE